MNSVYRLISLALVLGAGLVCAGEPRREPNDPNVGARFKVAPECDLLVLPVTYKGKTYQFVLDTGATHNAFDASLSLGKPIGEVKAKGADGAVRLRYYVAPPATVGGLSLKTSEPIIGFDFTKLRQVTGYEVYGFIGMPFLRQHVVQVDFDKGEVLVLKEPGRECGQPFAVTYDEQMLPRVSAFVGGEYKEEFMLDTGLNGSGNLATKSFNALHNKRALTVVGSTLSDTISGTKRHRIGQLKQLSLGNFTLRGAVLTEGRTSRLGLKFCSRFVVTLDFPNNKVYLKRGKNFDREDLYDLSGLHLLRKDGKVVVDSVDKSSTAEAAGLRAGDLLVKVGDVKADVLSMFQLRQRFSTETKKLRVTIRRGEMETEVILALSRAK